MQRIIQIKHKKREQIADPSFFLSMESLRIKCNLWEQLCLTFREEKNNNRNFLKCSHQNAILWRGLSFIGSHPFRLREAFLHCVFFFLLLRGETIIMQWFVVFHFQQFQTEHCPSQDYFQAHNGNKPARFIVQFNPQPFCESMCILCPSNKSACWMNNHLSLLDNVFVSDKCSQLWEAILKTNAGETILQYLQNSRSYDTEASVWWKKRLTRDCLSRKKKHPRGGHLNWANVSMWNPGRSSVWQPNWSRSVFGWWKLSVVLSVPRGDKSLSWLKSFFFFLF